MDSRRIGRRTTFRVTLAAGLAVLAATASSCVIPTPPAPPTAPVIRSFGVLGGTGPAPAVVALGWTATDANGDRLTCTLDLDGDGVDDLTVDNCGGSRSRNIEIPAPTSFTARLTVSDGSFPAVTATTTVSVVAGRTEGFDLQLRGIDSLSGAVAAAFTDAETYWESTIVRGIPEVALSPGCLAEGLPTPPTVVDDVIIDVGVTDIDGVGEILGMAGPTCYNSANQLPATGVMEFDSADVDQLVATGQLDEVILHEMAHVLGFGTMWDTTTFGGTRKIIANAGRSNVSFVGARGVAEYSQLSGTGTVPVENSGGEGTADSHWRESRFRSELMTGYLNVGANPVSRMTIASLADLGYQVTLSTAQPYSLPTSGTGLRAAGGELTDPGRVLRPTPVPAG